ncbi:MAG: enoyl-CoA hydratase/isomerase family protein [Alphaproteobacteria bacterium]|jgi:methylglutaconyl-CoA hydratase|nr:enoyl-CoA hydratase/isomerase family protein [Alphaproteobacteria bacterium]
MTDALLLTHDDRGVGRITLNRPDVHNAFNEDLINALDDAITEVTDDAAVRVVVITGNGKSFSAGADLNWMKRTADYDFAENKDDALRFGVMLGRLASMPKPVVGIIQGPAYGGGVGLVSACDIAIAGKAAAFMLSEVKLGLIPAVISPYVVRAMGARQARRYFLSAERIDAATARTLGLVHEVVADAELEEAAEAMIARLLKNSPAAMGASKDLIEAVGDRPTDRAVIEDTARRIAEARASDDGREGIAAFLEKRKPIWPGQG